MHTESEQETLALKFNIRIRHIPCVPAGTDIYLQNYRPIFPPGNPQTWGAMVPSSTELFFAVRSLASNHTCISHTSDQSLRYKH